MGEGGAFSAAQTALRTTIFANHWLKGQALSSELPATRDQAKFTVDDPPKFTVVILSVLSSPFLNHEPMFLHSRLFTRGPPGPAEGDILGVQSLWFLIPENVLTLPDEQ